MATGAKLKFMYGILSLKRMTCDDMNKLIRKVGLIYHSRASGSGPPSELRQISL